MSSDLRAVLKDEYGLENRDEITDIEPAVATLDAIGNPQESFQSFHVAGTNGKGSTALMIAEILQRAGHDVGLTFGPPVNGYLHKFQVNREPISRERFLHLADAIVDAAEPSLYEVATAIAFQYFEEEDVDVAVVETGIGGRYDATNALTNDVSVFTSVSKDHTDLLGTSREDIAAEHAAIINEDSVAVANVDDDVQHVFKDAASEHDVPFHTAPTRVRLEPEDGLRLQARFDDRSFATDIMAEYQEQNSNTALAALDRGLFDYEAEDVVETLQSFSFPGRMQFLDDAPLTVADGAHNPAAVEEVCTTLARFDGEITAVFGVMDDKDWEKMLAILEDAVDRVFVTDVANDRAADPDDLAQQVGAEQTFDNAVEAVDVARASVEEGMVFVVGSLYLCRDVLEAYDG